MSAISVTTGVGWALALLCGTGESDGERVRVVRRVQVSACDSRGLGIGTDIALLCTGTVALAIQGAFAPLPGCRPPPQSASRSRFLGCRDVGNVDVVVLDSSQGDSTFQMQMVQVRSSSVDGYKQLPLVAC